ncbi:MAG: SDR family oxidoreductase [Bacteroidetes bacterium]|nr:SDR family oxidoreductase [Bacteroidota bacterium]NCQ12035.1 SDR family oxidoreductase [Bacteroidota bacterium]
MVLNDKWIWISGASSGIGEALAKNLANKGGKVIISARNSSKLEAIHKENPDSFYVIPMDVASDVERKQALEKVKELTNTVDIIIHSAGVSQRSSAVKTELSVLKALFEVNFFGLVELNRMVLPLLKSGSQIVVINSLVGKFATPFRTAYSASKHALDGYFEGLAYELTQNNIEICMVYPGYIKTDISLNALTAKGSKYGKMDETQEKGMSADRCAEIIVNGLIKRKKEIIVGGSEIIGMYLKRFFPSLLKRIISKRAITFDE